MKILVAHNEYLHRGGEDLCVDQEIKVLREAGLSIVEFRPRNESNLTTYRAALAAPWGGGFERRLENLLNSERPDILHVHNLFPLLSPRVFRQAKALGIKTVLTLHNYRPLCLNGLFLTPRGEVCERCPTQGQYGPGIVRGCYRGSRLQSAGLSAHLNWRRKDYDLVDCFIAPSSFLKDKYVQYKFPSDKITVQGHFLPELPDDRPETPDPYVLYLGRLSSEKGVPWLLSAFSSPQFPIKLIVAGDGPLKENVIAKTGSIISYVGYKQGTAKKDLLRRALALVMPSECYENFPLAVAEANAWGTPAVVSDHGGLREAVKGGENGYRYTPGDVNGFWKALSALWPVLDSMILRQKTQRFAHDRFSKESFLASRLRLYTSLVSKDLRVPEKDRYNDGAIPSYDTSEFSKHHR